MLNAEWENTCSTFGLEAHAREFVSPFLFPMHAAQEKMQISTELVNL